MTENRNVDPLDWTPNNPHRPAEYAGPFAPEATALPVAGGTDNTRRTRWQLAVSLTAGALLAGAVGGLAGVSLGSPTTSPAADPASPRSSDSTNGGAAPGHLPPAGEDDGGSADIAND